jgi:hypothetical protein
MNMSADRVHHGPLHRETGAYAVRLVEHGRAAETAAASAGEYPDDMSLDAPPAPRPCRWGARIQS